MKILSFYLSTKFCFCIVKKRAYFNFKLWIEYKSWIMKCLNFKTTWIIMTNDCVSNEVTKRFWENWIGLKLCQSTKTHEVTRLISQINSLIINQFKVTVRRSACHSAKSLFGVHEHNSVGSPGWGKFKVVTNLQIQTYLEYRQLNKSPLCKGGRTERELGTLPE